MITLLLISLAMLVSWGRDSPDLALTPGSIRASVTADIACSTKWGLDRRAVTETMKRQVAASYGIQRASIVGSTIGLCCEFDHLIPRELGGADVVQNLWPQRWVAAKKKDALENRLHALVCSGSMALADAQRMIASDWVSAYQMYVVKRNRP